MQHLAKLVQGQGRGNDTLLVHMTPREVGGLQALATAHGGSLTVNPKTGLPEAGFLDSILPMLGGALGGALTDIPPWMIGLGAAGVQSAITGDLGAGLMAGLGAFGGASIGSAFGPDVGINPTFKTGLGPGVVGSPIQSGTGGGDDYSSYLEGASPSASVGVGKAAVPTTTDPLGRLVSASRIGMDPQGSFAKFAPWAAGLGVISPLLSGGVDGSMQTYNPDASGGKKWNYNGPYKPAPRRVVVEPRRPGDSSEALFFDKTNPYPGFVGAASGGLVALAGGGSPDVSNYAADFASKFARGNFDDGQDSSEQLYNFARPAVVVPAKAAAPVAAANLQAAASSPSLSTISGASGLGDIYTGGAGGGGYGGVGQGTADLMAGSFSPFNYSSPEQNYGFTYPSQIPNGPDFDYQIHANDINWGPASLPGSQTPTLTTPYGGLFSGMNGNGGTLRTAAGLGSLALPFPASVIPSVGMGIYDVLSGNAPPNTSAETIGGKVAQAVDPSQPSWIEKGIYDLLNPGESSGGGGSTDNSVFDLGSMGLAGYPSSFGYFGLGGNLSPLNTGDMGGAFGFSNFGGSASNGGGWGGNPTADYNGGRGEAKGGENLRDGSFVVDARTVSELGNGSSRAGQELLSRLGGQAIDGPGDGVSDSIRANINNGEEEARVARDEVKFSPEAVAQLGGGDTDKGAKYLYSLMAKAKAARKKADHGQDTGLRALVGAT